MTDSPETLESVKAERLVLAEFVAVQMRRQPDELLANVLGLEKLLKVSVIVTRLFPNGTRPSPSHPP